MSDQLVVASVTPSPYQRDVFLAIARQGRVGIRVHYFEPVPHDTPWDRPSLEPWERILPGRTLTWKGGRSHVNWSLPQPAPGEFWIVNGAMTDLTTQLLMRRLGRRTPWAFWGELPSQPAHPWRRWLQRRQYAPLQSARFVAAVGQRAVAAYQSMLPRVRVHNLPYACDLPAFAAARPTAHAGVVLLFCGQMIARKGIDLLLNSFVTLLGEGLPVRLMLIGREGDLPSLLNSVPTDARRHIDYRGFLQPKRLPEAFSEADVFVLPSRHDGWGVVVNQALGAGLPVVVSDAAGASELIKPGLNGLAVSAGNQDALTSALRQLCTDHALRTRLGHGARDTAARLGPEVAARFWEDAALNSPAAS